MAHSTEGLSSGARQPTTFSSYSQGQFIGMPNYRYRLEVGQQPVRARMCGNCPCPLFLTLYLWFTGFGDKVLYPILITSPNRAGSTPDYPSPLCPVEDLR
jgi:hypothetical protein